MNKRFFVWVFLFLILLASVDGVGALPCAEIVLYVDINDGSCSDAYSNEQAANSSTPWCTFTKALSGVEDGDTVIMATGIYNQENSYSLSTKAFTNETTIKSDGGYVEINNYIASLYSANDWNNESGTAVGLWNISYSTGASYLSVMREDTNETLMLYTSLAKVTDTANPEGCYFKTATPDTLWCRFDDTSFDPNDVNWYIGKGAILTLADIDNLKLDGLSFRGGLKSITMFSATPSHNITITNGRFIGATGTGGSTGTGIIDLRNSDGLIVTNNYIEQLESDDWDWTTIKGGPMEASAIRFENCGADITVSGNEINTVFNGIYFTSDTIGEQTNTIVSNNVLYDIRDDAIELEGYGSGAQIHHNNITDSFVGISIIPYNSSYSLTNVSYNIFEALKYNFFNLPSTYYYGEAIKLAGTGFGKNVLFDHNTFIGKGIYAGSAQTHIMYDVNFTNNIFYANNSGRLIDKSGLASDGVFYNYNSYYITDNNNYFRYWNNDSSTVEYNLSEALASSNWDTTWDINSLDVNPSLIDYVPSGSVCTASSTGSYVGAWACVASLVEEVVEPVVEAVSSCGAGEIALLAVIFLVVLVGFIALLSELSGSLSLGLVLSLLLAAVFLVVLLPVIKAFLGGVC